MKPFITITRYTNGMVCMLTPKEPIPAEVKSWTPRDTYTCYQSAEIGYITSVKMGLHGPIYVDGTNGNHVRVGCRSFKIEDVNLIKGDFFTIDLGGRISRYSGK